MRIERIHENIRYTLSNEELKVGDKVFPIARGRCTDSDEWILHDFDFRDFMCGFPDEPHTIKDMHYSDSKPYEIHTNMGYGPKEQYFKIIKKEKHVRKENISNHYIFVTSYWEEIKEE